MLYITPCGEASKYLCSLHMVSRSEEGKHDVMTGQDLLRSLAFLTACCRQSLESV